MPYPADLQLHTPTEVANWRPLVHWLLAIPHLLITNVLNNLACVLALISWFSIVFTGRLPAGIAQLQCLILRYEARTYSYVLWLREPYPPFEFPTAAADPATDPLRVDLAPQLENRDRLTVGLRLLWMVPIVVFTAVVTVGAIAAVIVASFAVVVTGRWPRGLRRFVVDAARLLLRVHAYGRLLVDDYPRFTLAQGTRR